MLTTSASQPLYGRTICPGKGLFVRVTCDPDTGGRLYNASKSVTDIVARIATDSRSGLTTNFDGSATPYPIDGGTTTVFESPTAIPCTPRSKPLMTCRGTAPTENERGCHVSRHVKAKAFGYDALSFATDAKLVSNTSPSSANVPM